MGGGPSVRVVRPNRVMRSVCEVKLVRFPPRGVAVHSCFHCGLGHRSACEPQARAASNCAQTPMAATQQNACALRTGLSLPPDKLAKAIALNKIRVTLCISRGRSGAWSSCGGCCVRARLRDWTRGRSGRHSRAGCRGSHSLPSYPGHYRLPVCPLRYDAHSGSRHLRHQRAGLGKLVGDQGKGLAALAGCWRAGCCCCSTGSFAARRGATGYGSGWHRCR